MRNVKFLTCLLAGLLAWTAMTPAVARRDGQSPDSHSARETNFSLDEAVGHVRRDTGGRVLSTQTRAQANGPSYRIKVLLPNASVRYIDIEAPDRQRH